MKTKISILIWTFIFCFYSQNLSAQNYQTDILSIEVHTADNVDAGTNKEHILTIHYKDSDRKNSIELLKYIDGNGLERSSVDKFSFETSIIGEIEKITVRPKDPDLSKWEMYKIVITNGKGIRYKFICNCMVSFYRISGKNADELYPVSITDVNLESDVYNMQVEIKTGLRSKAGTNANVYLTLITENGNGPPIKLNPSIYGNAFESGDKDIAILEYDIYSELKSINIKHDNKGIGAGWYLESIKIITPVKEELTFHCNCWLEGDYNAKKLFPIANASQQDPIYFQSRIAGKYLDVQWGKSAKGTPLHLWPGNLDKAQQFYLEKADDTYYYIRSALGADKYLTAGGNAGSSEYGIVMIWDGKIGSQSKWAIEPIGSDYFLIKSKLGMYLDVKWGDSEDGTPIHMWPLNKGNAQQWKILKNNGEKYKL